MATSKRKPFSIVLTIAVNSITTGVEERDSHRKGADFFDVVKYSAITFVSTSVSKSSATSYSVTGVEQRPSMGHIAANIRRGNAGGRKRFKGNSFRSNNS